MHRQANKAAGFRIQVLSLVDRLAESSVIDIASRESINDRNRLGV